MRCQVEAGGKNLLSLIAADVVVLHAEDAIGPIEGTLQGCGIGQVGLDDLGAELSEGSGLLPIGVPGQGPNPPMVLQQAVGHRTTLQAGRPHHRDDLSVVLRHRCRPPAKTSLSDVILTNSGTDVSCRHIVD